MNKKDKYTFKVLISITIFLILGIISKSNKEYHNIIHYHLYEKSFNYDSIYSFYNKYLGGTSFYKQQEKTIPVFKEKIKYNSITNYKEGLKLSLNNDYLIPSLNDGIVTLITTKKYYGKTIIIKTKDNINIWYGNICNPTPKMYDRLKKGDYIGTSCSNYIYIVYEKNGKYLNYKNYFPYQ